MSNFNTLYGLEFYSGDTASLVRELVHPAGNLSERLRAIHTINIDHVASLRTQPGYHAASQAAWVRTVDGWPVSVAARFLRGRRIPRITGADFFAQLCPMLDPGRHRLAFVVPNARTQAGLVEYFGRRGFRCGQLHFCCPPFQFEYDIRFSTQMVKDIVDHHTTHLFMGVGSPKSEIWVHEHARELGPMYVGCFGAALEFLSGARRRAPRVFRAAGLEWGWRLWQDPHRLGKRYVRALFYFVVSLPSL